MFYSSVSYIQLPESPRRGVLVDLHVHVYQAADAFPIGQKQKRVT